MEQKNVQARIIVQVLIPKGTLDWNLDVQFGYLNLRVACLRHPDFQL